jgi:MFS family permease
MYRLYFYKFLIDFWVIVPIIVPFYKANGMNATQILTVQASFSLSQLLFEIPSGYFSDVFGRRISLIAAAVLMFTGVGIYAISDSFSLFILAELVLGCAGAMRSGADSAILYDYIRNRSEEHRYQHFEGIAEFWARTGTAVSSVLGGLLGALATLRLPFYVNMISAAIMIGIGLSLREPQRAPRRSANPVRDIFAITATALKNRKLFAAMIQTSIIFSASVTAIWGYFLQYEHYSIPLAWYGIIFAVMQMSSASGARCTAGVGKRLGKTKMLLLINAIGLLMLLNGVVHHFPLLLLFIFTHAILWGMSTPFLFELIQRQTTSDIRATTLSVSSMIGRLFTIIVNPLFGYFIDHHSLRFAFIFLGGLYYAVLFLTGIRTFIIRK